VTHHASGHVRDIMTDSPITLSPDATIADAARAMRDSDVGAILVTEGEGVSGIITDRDIAIRAVAEGRDPQSTAVADVYTSDVHTVGPDDGVDDAMRLMREHAVRRIPVVENGRPVGILAIGDLTGQVDLDGTMEDISAAPGDQ